MKIDNDKTRDWLFSHLTDAAWSAVIGVGAIFLLLPFDSEYLWISAIFVSVAVLLIYIYPRRWIVSAIGGLLCILVTNIASPLFLNRHDVYFFRSNDITEGITPFYISYGEKNAKLYPVLDPIKWSIWNWVASERKNIRVLNVESTSTGVALLHSPTERSLSQMAREEGDVNSVRVFIRVPANILTLETRNRGEFEPLINYNTRIRARIFEWQTPIRSDVPGLFSAVGNPNDIAKLVREAVRADLQFRTLLAGKTLISWRESVRPRERSMREEVRDTMISNGIADIALKGNVFSTYKLSNIGKVRGALFGLQRDYGLNDNLYRAAVVLYANMLLHGNMGPNTSPQLSFDPRDAKNYEEELLNGGFFALAELERKPDTLLAAKQHYQDWLDILNGNKTVEKNIDLQTLTEEPLFRSVRRYPDDDFSIDSIEKRFQGIAQYSNEYEQEVYKAAEEIFVRIEDVLNIFYAAFRAKEKLEQSSITSVKQKSEALLAILQFVRQKADFLSAPAADVIASELRMTEALLTAQSSWFLQLASGECTPKLEEFLGNDPVGNLFRSGVANEDIFLTALNKKRGETCAPYDREFLAHFLAQFISIVSGGEKAYNKSDYRRVGDILWAEYGIGKQCAKFQPSFMLLHLVLNLADDPRCKETRPYIDASVGADPGWMQDVYNTYGRPELYEGRNTIERLNVKFSQ